MSLSISPKVSALPVFFEESLLTVSPLARHLLLLGTLFGQTELISWSAAHAGLECVICVNFVFRVFVQSAPSGFTLFLGARFLFAFLLSRYLAKNSVLRNRGRWIQANLRLKDKGAGENSDGTTEGDSADIDVDEAYALECL